MKGETSILKTDEISDMVCAEPQQLFWESTANERTRNNEGTTVCL